MGKMKDYDDYDKKTQTLPVDQLQILSVNRDPK